jgi:hypothetical protein
MTRGGCPEEDAQQSEHSTGTVADDEPLVFATEVEAADLTIKIFPNGRLKDGDLSVCRASQCLFTEMFNAVVVGAAGQPKIEYKGYMWALANEIRAIVAKHNGSRDKTPHLTPKKVGAFCVIDDGEINYKAHARIGYSQPTKTFWSLHESVAARGDLLIAFQARGVTQISASPPFMEPMK